ncbi:hypothetical protein AV530_014672 [Patagioenas fasciata monilis]|uniref:Uncharacterized protein n=1 Tax=Patagioenas fasciata monilis TaxID=372326 RepID=A0A1V4KB29_PATFA|nr:hypothetical protein AV530_014672 [Patagioenas fasciata monilis]
MGGAAGDGLFRGSIAACAVLLTTDAGGAQHQQAAVWSLNFSQCQAAGVWAYFSPTCQKRSCISLPQLLSSCLFQQEPCMPSVST